MRRGSAPDPEPTPPTPALLAVALVAALGVIASVSFRIFDPDLWQHLLVGKVIWQQHAVPATHLWTWPSYGTPEVLPSWLFRALVWPFWSASEVWGLFAWRWLSALVVFGFAWATARRMGACGFAPLVAIVLCALVYRQRSQVRPENVAAVLLAIQLWILETRRHGGPDRSLWLVPIAWVWANAHISYYLGFAVGGLFLLDSLLAGQRPARGATAPSVRRLGWALLAAAGASFLNPFGWKALAQPFEYFFVWRHEPIFQIIGELGRIEWSVNLKNGLPVLMGGWAALIAWRAARGRLDRVEAGLCVAFTALAFFGQRFLGFYAVVAAPYFGRGLQELMRAMPLLPPLAARAAVAACACVAVGWFEWTRPELPIGVRLDPRWIPAAACDFMERQGVRGRGFNPFELGGYQLFRFWPDRDRLPFMDIHQTGVAADRYDYAFLATEPRAWASLDGRRQFDYALLSRKTRTDSRLFDVLDADSTWALVFADDIALLYVRRRGEMAAVAGEFGYRLAPGGRARLAGLQAECAAGTMTCDRLQQEVERMVASSPQNAQAHSLLANLALTRGRLDDARRHLQAALTVDPFTGRAHERLGLIHLEERNPREALREFQAERRVNGMLPGLAIRMGRAMQAAGDFEGAARWYRRELRADPGNREARDSLAVVESRR